MDITSANIRVLQRGYSRLFQQGRATIAPWYSKIATTVPSTTAQNVYPYLLGIDRMRKWVGDRHIKNMAALDYIVTNEDFELTVGIPRNSIEDDTYGIFSPRATMMGQAASKYPDELILDLMKNGQTRLGPDGQFFFDTDHPVNPLNAGAGVAQNYFTTTPLTAANFDLVRSAMMGFKSEDGQIMGAYPNLLVVPPQLEFAAKAIVNATLVVNGGSNVYQGAAEILMIPELASNPTEWYLLDTRYEIKPFIFQNRKDPILVALTSLTDENVFYAKEFVWGIDARGAGAYGLWFLAAKAVA